MATNILPAFNGGEWYIPSSCTLISSSDYDMTINTTKTWNGATLELSSDLAGKTVTIGCSSISSNGGFYLQNSDTWDDIAVLKGTTLEATATIPVGTNTAICFQSPSTVGEISIIGAYMYVEEPPIEEEPPIQEGNIIPPFTSSEWEYVEGAAIISKENYSLSLTTPTAWAGANLWSWEDIKEGDVITISVNSTSSNTRIQLWANDTDILKFPTGTEARELTITVPSSDGYDFCIVSNTANTTITVEGLCIYKQNDEVVEPTPPSTPGIQNLYVGGSKITDLFYGKNQISKMYLGDILIFHNNNYKDEFIIGYTPITNENATLVGNSVVVDNATDLKSALSSSKLKAGQTIYIREGTYNV